MMLKQDGGMSAPVRSVTWSYLSETETRQISHEPQPETIQIRCALRPEVRKVTWYNRAGRSCIRTESQGSLVIIATQPQTDVL